MCCSRPLCIATQYAIARFRDCVVFSIHAPEWPTHFPTRQRLTARTITVGSRSEHIQ